MVVGEEKTIDEVSLSIFLRYRDAMTAEGV